MPSTVPEAKPPRPSASSHSASRACRIRASSRSARRDVGANARRHAAHHHVLALAGADAVLDAAHRQRGPAGLVGRANAAPGVAVEVFVEERQIAPGRVALVAGLVAMAGTPSEVVPQE